MEVAKLRDEKFNPRRCIDLTLTTINLLWLLVFIISSTLDYLYYYYYYYDDDDLVVQKLETII